MTAPPVQRLGSAALRIVRAAFALESGRGTPAELLPLSLPPPTPLSFQGAVLPAGCRAW